MSTYLNLNVQVTLHPDMRLVERLTDTYWMEYLNHDSSARFLSQVKLTEGQLLEYLHDLIMIRLYQVSNATKPNEEFRRMRFRNDLYVPDGFAGFVLNQIGISSAKLTKEYTIKPMVDGNYKADLDDILSLGYTRDEVYCVDKPIAKGFYLDEDSLRAISLRLLRLRNVVGVRPHAFSPDVETTLLGVFNYVEQVTDSNVVVRSFTGQQMDDEFKAAAAIVGFTLLGQGLAVLYPNESLLNLGTVAQLYKVGLDSKKDSNDHSRPEK